MSNGFFRSYPVLLLDIIFWLAIITFLYRLIKRRSFRRRLGRVESETLKSNKNGRPFIIGERVRVSGGDNPEPKWLQGRSGYDGVITAIHKGHATVKLDHEISVSSDMGFGDFGPGMMKPRSKTTHVAGQWLVATIGWSGIIWAEPIYRINVSICQKEPNLERIPDGGGIGVWVEAYATMNHSEV